MSNNFSSHMEKGNKMSSLVFLQLFYSAWEMLRPKHSLNSIQQTQSVPTFIVKESKKYSNFPILLNSKYLNNEELLLWHDGMPSPQLSLKTNIRKISYLERQCPSENVLLRACITEAFIPASFHHYCINTYSIQDNKCCKSWPCGLRTL